jgi:hypothetical protein
VVAEARPVPCEGAAEIALRRSEVARLGVKDSRIILDIFLHKAETGPIIISDDKPIDRTRCRPGLGEEKRAQDVEYNLSAELEIFCLNRP